MILVVFALMSSQIVITYTATLWYSLDIYVFYILLYS